jgi:hypothetical protein
MSCHVPPIGSTWTEAQVTVLQSLFTLRVKLGGDSTSSSSSTPLSLNDHHNQHDDDGILSQLTPPTRSDGKSASSSSNSSLMVQLVNTMRRCSVASILGSSAKFGQLLLTFVTSYGSDARHHRTILLECANNLTTFFKKTTTNKLNAL